MDPGAACGNMAGEMTRWLPALVLIGLVALGARSAGAQVFKPRNGSKATAVAKPAAPAKKPSPSTTPVAASASKKPTRSSGASPRRVVTTTPAKKPARGKARHDDDDVKITDD
jgi:hypothetical protein